MIKWKRITEDVKTAIAYLFLAVIVLCMIYIFGLSALEIFVFNHNGFIHVSSFSIFQHIAVMIMGVLALAITLMLSEMAVDVYHHLIERYTVTWACPHCDGEMRARTDPDYLECTRCGDLIDPWEPEAESDADG